MRFRRALLLAVLVACLVGATNAGWTHADTNGSDPVVAIEHAPAATISVAAYVTPPPLRAARSGPVSSALVADALLALAAAFHAIRRDQRNPVPAFRFPAPRLRGPPSAAVHG
jgi:hypothetical protein